MKCRKCGTEIADKALICYRCGTATTEAKFQPASSSAKRLSPAMIALVVGVLLAVLAIVLVFVR